MLEIAFAAHEYMEEMNVVKNVVLAGLRRNGMLAYRPSLSAKKLVRACEQPWAAKLSQGSHRMPARWLEDRFSWLSDDGVPLKPDYSNLGDGVKVFEDMIDPVLSEESDKTMLTGKAMVSCLQELLITRLSLRWTLRSWLWM